MARECLPGLFCFEDVNYAYASQQGILTKIRACEHLQKFCEHEEASTHLIFASNSSKGQILRALSNLMGPFDTPSLEGKHPKGYQNRVFNSQKGHDGRSRPLYMGFLLSLLPRVNNTSSEQLRKEGELIFTSNFSGICWVEALKTARVDAASSKFYLTRVAIGL